MRKENYNEEKPQVIKIQSKENVLEYIKKEEQKVDD